MRFLAAVFCIATGVTACSPSTSPESELSSEAGRQFYQRYEAALQARRGDTLAAFYRQDSARIIINGMSLQLSNAGIDSIYRGDWQGPSDFAFEDLHFEPIGPGQLLVTGGFNWIVSESSDTLPFIYLAILEQTDVGPRIRLEHETQRPDAPRTPPDSAGGG